MLAEKKAVMCSIDNDVLFYEHCDCLASFERGDEGQEVIDIQKRLVELQYKVSNVDGKFGPETEAAVKQFQTDKSLEVDGIIGNDTYRALMQKDMLLIVPVAVLQCVMSFEQHTAFWERLMFWRYQYLWL